MIMVGRRQVRNRSDDEFLAHMSVIAGIIGRWHSGELSTGQKRGMIADENRGYYGEDRQSWHTGEMLTEPPRVHDEIPRILADGTGVPLTAAQDAVTALRAASAKAARAPSPEDEHAIRRAGRDAFDTIMRTAGGKP